jgi:uncharacterized protein (TIGR02145 family)
MKRNTILIFILFALFISACEKTEHTYPVAVFTTAAKPRPLYKFTLDASASFSGEENDYLQYRWDLNGDHLEWETGWMNSPVLTLPYPFSGDGIIGLQVKNSEGQLMELYREIWSITNSDRDYWISEAYSDLTPDFRLIRYSAVAYTDDYLLTYSWAYDNILQSSSDSVYNFENSYEQASYGSLISWEAARQLDSRYHLPSLEEWQHMFDFSCGKDVAGYNFQVEVEHGLNLKCAGIYKDAQLLEFEESGYYWSGEEASESTAYAMKISKNKDEAELVELSKSDRASVRLMYEHYQYFD